MKKFTIIMLMLLSVVYFTQAQVAIKEGGGSPDGSAMLDVNSSTKGFLPPRMTTMDRNSIITPATGLVIFNLDNNCLEYFNSSQWVSACEDGVFTTAVFSIGTGGAASNFASFGNYYTGTTLDGTNYVSFDVNVTETGTWIVTSDQINAYNFSGNGTFNTTGVQSVTLYGIGTPTDAQTDSFTATGEFMGGTCTFDVTVDEQPAVYTIGTGGPASNFVLSGDYVEGVTLDGTNYVSFGVTVTLQGAWSIDTDTINGYSFSGSGSFGTMGYHTVTLLGDGTPVIVQTDNFTSTGSNGSGTCTFDVPVDYTSAVYSIGTGGAATNFVLSGDYLEGVALTAGDTLNFDVTVTNPGYWSIATDTINGYSFTGSGLFDAAGTYTVSLIGDGTPVIVQTDSFTATGDGGAGGTCTFDVPVDYDTAAYSIGTGGTATNFVINGDYTEGVALTAADTVNFDVTVTEAGYWSIATDTINGYSFTGSGLFDAAGTYTVTLLGDGTPVGVQTDSFTATGDGGVGGSCTFDVTVVSLGITLTTCGTAFNYLEVTNPTTGDVWLDRNLGAIQLQSNYNDYLAYGSMYQWGRLSDDHECMNWTSTSAGTRVNGITTTRSSSDIPGHNMFIKYTSSPYDWRNPQNDNLWQGPNGVNNPCPNGYRLPTENEANAERLSWSSNTTTGAWNSPMKWVRNGYLNNYGNENNAGTYGYYGVSTVDDYRAKYLFISNAASVSYGYRANGYAVRCIKDVIGTYSIGNGGSALNFAIYGPYNEGIELTSDSYLTLDVNVTTAGSYLINTDTVNGYSFTGNGLFSSTGVQSITLYANGTPTSAQTDNFTATGNNSGGTCTFDVTVEEPIVTSSCGNTTVYTEVTNATTGAIWLDKDINSSIVPTSRTDYNGYGSMYQWGRLSDGHECMNWTSPSYGMLVNGTTTTLSSTDIPGHSNFILTSTDWRTPSNNTLWQGGYGINNPCPQGYRIPTRSDWNSEIATWSSADYTGAYNSVLKIPSSGRIISFSGNEDGAGSWSYLWSSTIFDDDEAYAVWVSSSMATTYQDYKAYGHTVRCIKDQGAGYSIGTGGSATNLQVFGDYIAGVGLITSNYVTLDVTVTNPGSWVIETNTINGYSFNGAGIFEVAGTHTVILYGTGIPVTLQTDGFTATGNFGTGGTCTFDINVIDAIWHSSCGNTLAYLEVTNTTTGNVWLDRNLGAQQVGTVTDDHLAFGSLFQWGRLSDGHECINWTSSTSGSAVYGTTTTLSTTDDPGHNMFILNSSSPRDWRSTQNDNLWQGANGTNNPCPNGFRLPTQLEWTSEMNSWSSANYIGAYDSPLKLVRNPRRYYSTGGFAYLDGNYYSSTVPPAFPNNVIGIKISNASTMYPSRAEGYAVRCIKDIQPPATYSIGTGGSCLNNVVNGTYYGGIALDASHSVEVDVTVTSIGSYSISSDTINGYWFNPIESVFWTTGTHTLTFTADGTPTTAQVDNFTLTADNGGGTCNFDVTVEWDNLVYQLSDTPNIQVFGTYTEGVSLDGANYITFDIDVSNPGTIASMSSQWVNDYWFTDNNLLFETAGIHSVTLFGVGTPTSGGTDTFLLYVPNGGGSPFDVTVNYTSANYTIGTGGSCLNTTVNGTYKTNTTLDNSNTVDLEVNVTKTGLWNITTNLINGYSFSGSGTITTTGTHIVTIEGSGNPNVVQTDNFIANADNGGGTCTFDVSVVLGDAAYSIGTGGSANNLSLNGDFFVGLTLSGTEFITFDAIVTTPGSWNVSTDVINGYGFTGSGTFATAGTHTVTIYGSGTPLASQTDSFTAISNNGGGSCTFDIAVSPNQAPVATNVEFTGILKEGQVLEASYTFIDHEDDIEGTSIYQWYKADDASGTNQVTITNATSLNYTVTIDDEDKYISFSIIPVALTGTTTGLFVQSPYQGFVTIFPRLTTCGKTIVYDDVAYFSETFLNKNLGADSVANSSSDYHGYGSLYQWGRSSDGHECINWTGFGSGSPVNGTTTVLSANDFTGHSLFIITTGNPDDWRDPQNANLWQGVSGVNNPCPSGYRVPIMGEIQALTSTELYNSSLKLPAAGFRDETTGTLVNTATEAMYWTSTDLSGYSALLHGNVSIGDHLSYLRANGASVRCIKD